LNALRCLRGRVERARVVGCTEHLTAELLRYLWEDIPEDESQQLDHYHRVTPSTMYPLIPGQWSYLDYGSTAGCKLVKHQQRAVEQDSDRMDIEAKAPEDT
jgi:hypothetical protein